VFSKRLQREDCNDGYGTMFILQQEILHGSPVKIIASNQRLPEVHAPIECGSKVKKTASSSYKAESRAVIDLQKRRDAGDSNADRSIRGSSGNLVAAAGKDKEDAAKRLRERIAGARSKKGAAKKKK
jgi:hypothetical protein